MTRKCKQCEFCVRIDETHRGKCHRFPPPGDRTTTINAYPIVDLNEGWCGEWKERKSDRK